jgi:hypothetical protein
MRGGVWLNLGLVHAALPSPHTVSGIPVDFPLDDELKRNFSGAGKQTSRKYITKNKRGLNPPILKILLDLAACTYDF